MSIHRQLQHRADEAAQRRESAPPPAGDPERDADAHYLPEDEPECMFEYMGIDPDDYEERANSGLTCLMDCCSH